MNTYQRIQFGDGAVINYLFQAIKRGHRVADHTAEVLLANKDVENFCEEARTFVVIGQHHPYYCHYDTSSWYNPGCALVKIDAIAVYDNFEEYETARREQMGLDL